MTQLKNNSHYKNLLANEHFKGQVDKIDEEYNTLKVSVQTSHSGTLSIFHSLDGLAWSSFGDVFTITEDTHKQVALKGKFLYVSYLNGATATTNFNLVSYLSKSIHNNIDVKLTQEDEVSIVPVGGAMDVEVVNSLTIEGMNFTPEGALIVSGGGGGGGGGDASAANQLEQITLAETLNTDVATIKAEALAQTSAIEAINEKIDVRVIKCDTENVIIDSSDPVQTVLLAKVENTLNNAYLNVDSAQNLKVTVANQNDISTLATEETQAEIKTQVDKLTFVDSKLKVYEEPLITTEPIYLDFNKDSPSVIGDSPAGCWYNPEDDIEGWGYINEIQGGGQVYYYTNTGLVPNASEPNITLGSVTTGWCVASLNLITTNENTWIMAVYTKPTGSGDAQIWYHSRKSYQVSSSFPLSKGVDYLFYWGENPTTVHPELQHVEMALASTQGPADPSEIVQFMSLNVPSVVPQYQFVGRVKRAGYVRSGISREVHFLNSNKVKSELKLAQLKFNTILPGLQAEAPLFVSLDNATYTTDEVSEELQLNVRDDKLSRELASLNSTVGQGLYINMESDPVVSGGLKLTGDATTKSLFVNVTNTESIPVSGTFYQETQPVSGSVSVSNFPETQPISGSVSVSNFPETQPVSGTFWQETQPVSGSVSVSNFPETQPVSGTFWQETQPVSGSVSVSNFPETQPVSGTVGISGSVGVTGTFWQETQPVSGSVSVSNFPETQPVSGTFWQETQPISGSVSVSNFPETQPVSGTVGISGSVEVTGTFWQETQPVSGSVSVSNFPETQPVSGSVSVSNFPETQPVSGTVGISGSVESHCYGSSDGIAWHHLKTNTNGVLSTNAIVETANGTLTSTVNDEVNALDVQVQNIVNANLRTSTGGLLTSTSAGTINSLDVAIKAGSDLRTTDNGALTSTLSGTGNSVHALDVQVKNTSITAIQKSQPPSIQTILTNEICNCTGPADSRALTTSYDTTGFLYVSVVLNITNYSMSGYGSPNIYLQSSPDGVLWFNESSNSVYQNGAMKIQAYNVLTVPYVRLYLDCNSITSPNVIQFTISTALLCQK